MTQLLGKLPIARLIHWIPVKRFGWDTVARYAQQDEPYCCRQRLCQPGHDNSHGWLCVKIGRCTPIDLIVL